MEPFCRSIGSIGDGYVVKSYNGPPIEYLMRFGWLTNSSRIAFNFVVNAVTDVDLTHIVIVSFVFLFA